MRGARRGDAQAPRGGLAGAARHQAGSWTAQLDRCSIKQKRKNDQTVVPPGGGTVEDNDPPRQEHLGRIESPPNSGCSNLTFSMTLEEVIAGCEEAWEFFGGVFRVLVPDNMSPVVAKADAVNPRLTREWL